MHFYNSHPIPFHCLYYTDLENLTAEQMEFSTHVVLYHKHLTNIAKTQTIH